jgi:UDP-N-acetylmuramoylalanine--D-glutamate ligase
MNLIPASCQRVLILGLGESGRAMARFAQRCGWALRLADTRLALPVPLSPALGDAPCHLGPFDAALLEGMDAVFISPGLDPRMPFIAMVRARGLPVWGECTLFAHALAQQGGSPVVLGITGTNGKTTCTALATALLCGLGYDAVAAGNISPAMLDVVCDRLEAGNPLPAVWVLELSSFQLETAEGFLADAGLVLNLSQDHLDRYDSFADYADAKARLVAQSRAQVLNREDAMVWGMTRPDRPLFSFGTGPATDRIVPVTHRVFGFLEHDGQTWFCREERALLPVLALRLWGPHNALNALAVLALIEASGLASADDPRLLAALGQFEGLAHRVQKVAQRDDGLLFIDDSKGTNVGATLAALAGATQKVVLVAGGQGKGQDFSPLAPVVAVMARAVVLLGQDAPLLAQALKGTGVPIHRVSTMQEALVMANHAARPEDAVLLSPACASQDLFSNYKERGKAFRQAACALPGVCAL